MKIFKEIVGNVVSGDYHIPRNVENRLNNQVPEEFIRIVEKAVPTFSPLVKSEAQTLLSGPAAKDVDSLRDDRVQGKFIYLEPILDKNCMVPIMTFRWSMSESSMKVSIRIALLLEHDNNMKAMGYRFESGEGKHSYCHMQHIRKFDDSRKLSTEVWIPDESPAIPIEAGGPVGVILCAFGSLYGTKHTYTRLKEADVDITRIKRSIHKMKPTFFRSSLTDSES